MQHISLLFVETDIATGDVDLAHHQDQEVVVALVAGMVKLRREGKMK